jgi:type I restriction enzyme S subunit
MIADLKPYAEYKESGSKWLSAVPVTWEVRNLRTLISKRAERDRTDLPLLSVAREKGVFVRSLTDADENHNVIPDDLSNYKVARAGNLVINKMKAWQGSMGIAPCDGIVSPAYFVFDFRIANHAFGQRLLRSKPYVAHFGQASDGVRVGQWDLSIPGMRQIPVLVPPPDEQAAIVRFLDWANGRLERAIRAKRKVIALLNEQKQAIIHRAVTRGIDPSVPLKPSGISWLGDIPQHWDTPLNQRIFKEEIRPHNRAQETQLSLSQRDGLIATSEMKERSLQTATYDNWKVTLPGDLVLNRFKAHLGVFFEATLRGIVSFHYGVFAPRRRLHTKYFELLFHTYPYRTIYAGRSNGMTVGLQNLSNQNFYGVRAAVPPHEEQVAIVDFAERETQTIRMAISRLEREIEFLCEYRTRLVADVVTGKLDVREVAARLPDEAPLDAVEDDTDLVDENEAAEEGAAL